MASTGLESTGRAAFDRGGGSSAAGHRLEGFGDVVEDGQGRADAGLDVALTGGGVGSAGVAPRAALRGRVNRARVAEEERGVHRPGRDGELRKRRKLGVRL